MPMPTYDELLELTVHALQDLGGKASNNEIEQRVIEHPSLSAEVVREPHGTTEQTPRFPAYVGAHVAVACGS
ncbi:hypothetical protein ACFSC4_30040 [Deinococcus malanensis]|uniref:hypothetical protein n=1 Tax=Deinococcus malanensis TaxID=1706855 RepID=UPI00363B9AA0